MRELTDTLKQIMSVVSNQLELLPASQGALEEMTFVDEDERDDTKLTGENLLVETSLEIPKPTWKYRKVEPIPRATKHLFRYFLDGSYRHYFLATGLEQDRATPIFLAQISVVIIRRDDAGRLKVVSGFRRHQWFLLLAKARISDVAWQLIQKSVEEARMNIKVEDLGEPDPLTGTTYEGQDLRERGRGKTRYLMSTMEFAIVKEFRDKFSDGWIIKDGLVSLGKGGGGMQSPQVIGVAKNFTSIQTFHTHTGRTKQKESVISLLGSMPPHNRTTAYESYSGKTAFWYVRLRESQQVLYPLFGVIKVEIPLLPDQPLSTELLDEVSGALVAERSVTPYGSDDRWHSHLYAVYQAEHAAKQLFFSTQVIQGIINNALRK